MNLYSRMTGITLFLVLSGICSFAVGSQKTICTMTLNSSDEKDVFKKLYSSDQVQFVELVPANKDPEWLNNACRSGIQCDVLVVSGHFGGVFFGEGNSTTLDLKEIERLSCEHSCPGILQKPKDIFLMGCNTLPTKEKDKRTIEEYVEVLIHNGFPRDLAERVAFSRYSEYGMSISQIFASAFSGSARLHGFSSTGPLGKQAAPRLMQGLKNTSAESLFTQGPNVARLKDAFAGTSYRMVEPQKILDPAYKALSCQALSNNTSLNKEAVRVLSEKTNLKKYYEPLMQASDKADFLFLLQNAIIDSEQTRQNFVSFFSEIMAAKSLPLKMKLQLLKLQGNLLLVPYEKLQEQTERLIRQRLQDGLSFIVTDQFCSMTDLLQTHTLKKAWISLNEQNQEYLPRLTQCFGSYDKDIENTLRGMVNHPSSALRREALRALKGRIFVGDAQSLESLSANWPRRDRSDMFYSLNLVPTGNEVLSYQTHGCLEYAKQKSTPDERDGARWSCFNAHKSEIDTSLKCHQIARQFETASVTGFDWSCLTDYTGNIHLGACFEAAKRNKDPENSDDMRWYCWSKLSNQYELSRSECLALASSMRIQGNRFKANWNCMNRL